jgi:DNA-binding PadR family transcriptional regulator
MDDIQKRLPLSPQQFQILLTLTDGACHGYGIILDVAARTSGDMRLGTGTLYTAIARLLALEFIIESRNVDADGRRRYYRLTPLGRQVLAAETLRLETLVRQAHLKGIRPRPALSRP